MIRPVFSTHEEVQKTGIRTTRVKTNRPTNHMVEKTRNGRDVLIVRERLGRGMLKNQHDSNVSDPFKIARPMREQPKAVLSCFCFSTLKSEVFRSPAVRGDLSLSQGTRRVLSSEKR